MAKPPIVVSGLKPLVASLKQIDADLPKGMRIALNTVATTLVEKVRPQFPLKSGRARKSVRASSTRTAARVSMGGSRAPHTPWLDFGGRVGIRGSVEREFIKRGRYLYPTLDAMQPEIEQQLQDAVRGVAESAGLDVD